MGFALSLAAAISAFASTGKISFSDPSVTAGSEVNVTMKIAADEGAVLSDVNLTLGYDPSQLEFVSGTDAEGGAGTVRVHGVSNGGGTSELSYNLKFKALAEGTAVVSYDPNVNMIEVYDGDSQPLSLSHIGQSTITVAAAETEAAADASAEGEANVTAETAADGVSAGEAENLGIQLSSRSKTITIMNPSADVQVPDGFKPITIMVDGQKVQGWAWGAEQDPKYCVVYGMNDQGELNFYRYDMAEKTIQRYFEDPLAADSVSNQEYSALAAQYEQMRQDYDMRFLVIAILGVLVLILLATVIYLSARLSAARRSAEKPHPRTAHSWSEGGESEADSYDLYDGSMLSHDFDETVSETAPAPMDETQILRRPRSGKRAKDMGDTMPIPEVVKPGEKADRKKASADAPAADDASDSPDSAEEDAFETFEL